MIKKIYNKITGSFFIKLVLILIAAGILINISVGTIHHFQVNPRINAFYRANLEQYARYIINDIGNPPDLMKARKIAELLSIKITCTGPGLSWSTHENIPEIPEGHFQFRKNRLMKWYRGSLYFTIKKGKYEFLFIKEMRALFRFTAEYILLIIVLVSCIILGAYLMIRRLLRPIKLLDTGVQEISNGNFNYKVPSKGKDELGKLTDSFNDMSMKIARMIKSRDQLLLDVSHELRSPLTRIKVALELPGDSKTRSGINDDINDIEIMITEILENERLKSDHGKISKTSIRAVPFLSDIIKDYENMKPGIIFSECDENIIMDADPERLAVALKNILDNAMKYSQESSREVQVSLQAVDTLIEITVIDHGSGIAEEEIPFIFEPFYRVDRSRSRKTGGFGLGMNLCKNIIEAHDGTINVQSSPGKGTTVTVTIPLHEN